MIIRNDSPKLLDKLFQVFPLCQGSQTIAICNNFLCVAKIVIWSASELVAVTKN